jgi:hypothetical protein
MKRKVVMRGAEELYTIARRQRRRVQSQQQLNEAKK